jgi:hypothetical protein
LVHPILRNNKMAKIQIYGDSNKGCIFFDGSTVEPKFLGTIIATVKADETDRIVIQRTDRLQRDGVTFRKLFRRLKADRIQNQAGENLIADLGYSVADVAVYINNESSNYSAGGAVRPALDEHPNFVLDATQTTIMVDNGENFGVNTLKAVLGTDGLVDILSADHSGNAIVHYEDCPHGNLQINGEFISGGPNDVVNALNELFTVGAFESVVINDPYSTMIADVGGVAAGYTLEGSGAIDPAGNDIFTNTSTGNYAGLKSTATIDQAGEYFTFDIRGEGQIGFGLVHTDSSYAAGSYQGNANYADPDSFAVSNSAHYGYQFSHWFHQTPNGSWTNYGASTGVVYGSGWYNWESQTDWLAGNPVKIKVGIDENGFIAISSQQDDGSWILHARSSYPVPQGSEFHLGVKSANPAARVYSAPMVHLLEPAAPTMYFRYIESPDGAWSYPLFATAEEADYYELTESGVDNGSHTHVYPDDPTNTTWYMPSTSHQMNHGLSPVGQGMTFSGNAINWTEITSLTNAEQAPSPFAGPDYSFSEDATVAIQVAPQDVTYTTTVSGLPSGLSLNGGYAIQGTTRHVYGDQDYTVTVTRTNSYGSSQGTFTLTITDDVSQNAISGMTIYGQNPITQSPDTVHHYSGAVNLDVDLSLDAGTEIIWTQQNSNPDGGVGQYMQIGIADVGVDKMTTQLGNNPQHWQAKATIWTGTLNHNYATGWTDSSEATYAESNDNVEWKIAFPSDGGPIELYRAGVLVRTSSANFTGSQTLTVGVPVNYSTTTRMPSFVRADIVFAGDPPAGFTQEHGSMDNPTTLGDGGVVSLDQVLPVGKRLVVNKTWIETNVLPYCTDSLEKAYIGVPKTTAVWGSIDLHTDFDAVMRWEGQSTASHKTTIADGSDIVARHESNIGSATNAYYHYAIEWDGTNLTVLRDTDISKFSNQHDKYQFSGYSCYENYAAQSGDLPLVMATKGGGTMTLSMSGISLVDIPSAPATILTPWTKALDFSGSSERSMQSSSISVANTMKMNGLSVTTSAVNSPAAGGTNLDGNARPWATAIVFQADGHNSNQHIWNVGEGSGGSDDNIYLRLSSIGNLYFGWGRDGALNECSLGNISDSGAWHGVYVGHNGTRLSGSDATAANLAEAFDIHRMGSTWNGPFENVGANLSTSGNWITNGGRMDRTISGDLTIGGRGANRSFHGKVASFVSTTLRRSHFMPDSDEIKMMITDPKKWEQDYRVGQTVRSAGSGGNTGYQPANIYAGYLQTQMWLMGDGAFDNYSNMIRNEVYYTEQNYTKLNLISMVSNDIQNVNINGLS